MNQWLDEEDCTEPSWYSVRGSSFSYDSTRDAFGVVCDAVKVVALPDLLITYNIEHTTSTHPHRNTTAWPT